MPASSQWPQAISSPALTPLPFPLGPSFTTCSKKPQYKKNLVEELDTQKKEGKLTEPITLEQTKHVPYLQALYDGLRCHPAVGMSLLRVTPAGGTEIDGRYIPGGVRVVTALGHVR